MSEQEQAEALAAWLERGGPPPEEGLDEEVVEAVIALRPELAGPASVTADDILAGVREGPLAPTMPVGASEGEVQAAPRASNRPWYIALVGMGGVSAMGLAAAMLLTFGVVLNANAPSQMEGAATPVVAARPAEQAMEKAADTGRFGGRASPDRMAKPKASSQVARSAPAAAPRPSPRPAPTPMAVPLPEAEPAADLDAVAFADESDDFEDGELASGELSARRGMQPAKGAASTIPELSDAAGSGAGPRLSLDTEAQREEAPAPPPPMAPVAQAASRAPAAADDAYGGIAAESAKEDEKKRERADRDERRRPARKQTAEESVGAGAAAPEAPADEASLAASQAQLARLGTAGASHPDIDAARAALAAGDPAAAAVACERGLAGLTGNTRERQLLYALLGDARAALGDPAGARSAWAAANAIRGAR